MNKTATQGAGRSSRAELLGDPELMTDDDIVYIHMHFQPLAELCEHRPDTPEQTFSLIERGVLPAPSYLLPDGTGMFPPDYFALVDAAGGADKLHGYFAARCPADVLDEVWQGYLSGVYGVCLKTVTPENILRKGALTESIRELLAKPVPSDSEWQGNLKAAVDELDRLERPFSPDFDRIAFGRPPTRDSLIDEPRRQFPEIFSSDAAL